MGNHAGAPYASCILPPAPGQDPCEGQPPHVGYVPDDPHNCQANICFAIPGLAYKLRPDEAVLIIGKTPPPARYFSFRSYVIFVENKPYKDYSQEFTVGDETTGVYHRVFASLGDSLHNLDIHTENTPGGAEGDPFSSSAVIVCTADRGMNQQVRDALGAAGFSTDIMNDDNISAGLVNLGLEKGKDHLNVMLRVIFWEDPQAGAEYINNLSNYVKVLRITPKTPFADLNP